MAKHSYDKEFREGVIQYCLEHPDESYVSISKRFGEIGRASCRERVSSSV